MKNKKLIDRLNEISIVDDTILLKNKWRVDNREELRESTKIALMVLKIIRADSSLVPPINVIKGNLILSDEEKKIIYDWIDLHK